MVSWFEQAPVMYALCAANGRIGFRFFGRLYFNTSFHLYILSYVFLRLICHKLIYSR